MIPQQLVSQVTFTKMDAAKRDTPAKKLFGAFFDYKVGLSKTLPFRTPISEPTKNAYRSALKKSQREGEHRLKHGNVLWVSCTMANGFKQEVQGTYRRALHGPIGTGRK